MARELVRRSVKRRVFRRARNLPRNDANRRAKFAGSPFAALAIRRGAHERRGTPAARGVGSFGTRGHVWRASAV